MAGGRGAEDTRRVLTGPRFRGPANERPESSGGGGGDQLREASEWRTARFVASSHLAPVVSPWGGGVGSGTPLTLGPWTSVLGVNVHSLVNH